MKSKIFMMSVVTIVFAITFLGCASRMDNKCSIFDGKRENNFATIPNPKHFIVPDCESIQVPRTVAEIVNILSAGEKVSLIVATRHDYIGSGNIVADWENLYLNFFKSIKNFTLLDHSKILHIQRSLKNDQTGNTTEDTIVTAGKMAGATHMLSVDYSLYQFTHGPYHMVATTHTWTTRLIDIQTGKILAIDKIVD